MDYTALSDWRVALYHTMTREAAALMNILDGLLTAPTARRAIEVTLAPAFDRQYASFYQGLQQGRIDRPALRRLYCQHLPSTPGTRLSLILDASSVLRTDSPTARDRMAVHAAHLPPGSKPIGIGWQYSLLAVAPPTPSSWTYYLAGTRIRTGTTPSRVGAIQVAAVLPYLPTRPVLLTDRHYGSAAFILDPRLAGCDKLSRLQTHRVFYRPPPPRDPHRRGRPPTRGPRFQPKDPATHGPPTATWSGTEARGRPVTVRAWAALCFAENPHHPITLLECARQGGPNTKRDPRVIWLLWDSAVDPAPLPEVPDLYALRFSIEHGIRFDKQDLLWDEPRLRTGTFERWTDLMLMAHNTLVRARPCVAGVRLRWEGHADRPVTPAQVRRALAGIIPTLGTPAPPPQLRGKSPGRACGFHPRPAKRYPVVRKGRPASVHAPPPAR
jgi:hypothetical protein